MNGEKDFTTKTWIFKRRSARLSYKTSLSLSLSSLFKRRTVTTDMHFCYIVYILYSGSQSYIAASFSTVRGYETRRKVFGDPFNGRPLPE